MEPRIFRYIGGTSELLHTPLKNGLNVLQKGVDIVVTHPADARRLKSSPNKYREVTPAPAKTSRKPVKETVSTEDNAN